MGRARVYGSVWVCLYAYMVSSRLYYVWDCLGNMEIYLRGGHYLDQTVKSVRPAHGEVSSVVKPLHTQEVGRT